MRQDHRVPGGLTMTRPDFSQPPRREARAEAVGVVYQQPGRDRDPHGHKREYGDGKRHCP